MDNARVDIANRKEKEGQEGIYTGQRFRKVHKECGVACVDGVSHEVIKKWYSKIDSHGCIVLLLSSSPARYGHTNEPHENGEISFSQLPGTGDSIGNGSGMRALPCEALLSKPSGGLDDSQHDIFDEQEAFDQEEEPIEEDCFPVPPRTLTAPPVAILGNLHYGVPVNSLGSSFFRPPTDLESIPKKTSRSASLDFSILKPKVEQLLASRAAKFLKHSRSSDVVRRMGLSDDNLVEVASKMTPLRTIGNTHYIDLTSHRGPVSEPSQFHKF